MRRTLTLTLLTLPLLAPSGFSTAFFLHMGAHRLAASLPLPPRPLARPEKIADFKHHLKSHFLDQARARSQPEMAVAPGPATLSVAPGATLTPPLSVSPLIFVSLKPLCAARIEKVEGSSCCNT